MQLHETKKEAHAVYLFSPTDDDNDDDHLKYVKSDQCWSETLSTKDRKTESELKPSACVAVRTTDDDDDEGTKEQKKVHVTVWRRDRQII